MKDVDKSLACLIYSGELLMEIMLGIGNTDYETVGRNGRICHEVCSIRVWAQGEDTTVVKEFGGKLNTRPQIRGLTFPARTWR